MSRRYGRFSRAFASAAVVLLLSGCATVQDDSLTLAEGLAAARANFPALRAARAGSEQAGGWVEAQTP